MRIVIALVSELKDREIKVLLSEYLKRISKFAQVDFVEFKKGENISDIQTKYKQYYTIALAERGREYGSLAFAEKLQKLETYESSNLLFVVSDADGFQESELSQAREVLSLSKMTFPHELSTLVLAEQLYRALSIINNHPYHRE
jgi:23S rRNA (pseudouridine1915-N3)-methyltransferase